ncbi:methyltransferase [Candidatus Woesearchaeota archaeon]|nr:methyltransferase [Candidatus Woesearchaeota archaeon]
MKGLAISYKGMEDITALEIKELLKVESEKKEGCVVFDVKKLEDLALLCYKGQAVNRVLLLLDEFKISKIEDLKRISKIDFSEWLKNKTFAARCGIVGNKELSSQEVERATGDEINGKVNLDNPEVTVFVYIYKNNCYVGIDLGGDLSKREYKIFSTPIALKGTIAYSLLRIGRYDKEKTLLDPFCGSGEIIIEASSFVNNFPVNFYNKKKFPFLKLIEYDFEIVDKKIKKEKTRIHAFDSQQRYVKSAEKNAKIAGIQKSINFSRVDVADLELKFKEKNVDLIVTNPPRVSSSINLGAIKKIYHEFFYQAEYILNSKGKIVVCSTKVELLKEQADKFGFKIKEEREIEHGKAVLKVLVFVKKL